MALSYTQRRFLGRAIQLSTLSTYERVQIGALVVSPRGVVIGQGFNQPKSHPMQYRYNNRAGRLAPRHAIHAEIAAIANCRTNPEGSTLYVGRLSREGTTAMCRPCAACALAIQDSGIVGIYYTSPQGVHYCSTQEIIHGHR